MPISDGVVGRQSRQLGLYLDGADGGVKLMIFQRPQIDDFQLADEGFDIAAVIFGQADMDLADVFLDASTSFRSSCRK